MSHITGPTSYDINRNSYDSYNLGTQSNWSGPGTTGPIVHIDSRYPIPPEADPTLRRSRFQEFPSVAKYDSYSAKAKTLGDYKYNLYSLIDEPWNRCCEVGNCGNCPGN